MLDPSAVRWPREFSREIKRATDVQWGFRCALRFPEMCISRIEQHHHRKMKSRGGDGRPENCLPSCRYCHHHIHNRVVKWAERHALILPGSPRFTAELFPPVIGCSFGCRENHLMERLDELIANGTIAA